MEYHRSYMFVLPASDPVKLRELSMYDNRHVCGGYFFKKVTIEPLRIRESESSCLHVRDGFSYSQGGSNRVTAPYMSKKKASKKRQTGRRAVFANVWEGF